MSEEPMGLRRKLTPMPCEWLKSDCMTPPSAAGGTFSFSR